MKLTQKEYNEMALEAVIKGDTIISYSENAPQFKPAVLMAIRSAAALAFAMPAAIQSLRNGGPKIEVCHMGGAFERFPVFSDGYRNMVIVPANHEEIVVVDLKENNDRWDNMVNMTKEVQIETVKSMGGIFIRRSVRGGKYAFDDVKRAIKSPKYTWL